MNNKQFFASLFLIAYTMSLHATAPQAIAGIAKKSGLSKTFKFISLAGIGLVARAGYHYHQSDCNPEKTQELLLTDAQQITTATSNGIHRIRRCAGFFSYQEVEKMLIINEATLDAARQAIAKAESDESCECKINRINSLLHDSNNINAKELDEQQTKIMTTVREYYQTIGEGISTLSKQIGNLTNQVNQSMQDKYSTTTEEKNQGGGDNDRRD